MIFVLFSFLFILFVVSLFVINTFYHVYFLFRISFLFSFAQIWDCIQNENRFQMFTFFSGTTGKEDSRKVTCIFKNPYLCGKIHFDLSPVYKTWTSKTYMYMNMFMSSIRCGLLLIRANMTQQANNTFFPWRRYSWLERSPHMRWVLKSRSN